MGYCGLMGYGVQFPAHRGGGPKNVWDFGGYGLWQAWVMRVLTVPLTFVTIQNYLNGLRNGGRLFERLRDNFGFWNL